MDAAGEQLLGAAQGRDLLMRGATQGFSLIELAIALVVLGLLMSFGLPAFTAWINNTKVRTAAEGILNGVQLARAEAVRQNLNVQFSLGGATVDAWTVSSRATDGTLTQVQQRVSEGTGSVNVVATPSTSTLVTFTGVGRVASTNPSDGTAPITQIDVCSTATNVASSELRKMRIVIGPAGTVKMCDPQVASTDPRACPSGGTSAC